MGGVGPRSRGSRHRSKASRNSSSVIRRAPRVMSGGSTRPGRRRVRRTERAGVGVRYTGRCGRSDVRTPATRERGPRRPCTTPRSPRPTSFDDEIRRRFARASARSGDPSTLMSLTGSYMRRGRFADAESLWRGTLEGQEAELGPDHPDTAGSLFNLGQACYAQGRLDEAEALFGRSLAINEASLGPEHPVVAADRVAARARWRSSAAGPTRPRSGCSAPWRSTRRPSAPTGPRRPTRGPTSAGSTSRPAGPTRPRRRPAGAGGLPVGPRADAREDRRGAEQPGGDRPDARAARRGRGPAPPRPGGRRGGRPARRDGAGRPPGELRQLPRSRRPPRRGRGRRPPGPGDPRGGLRPRVGRGRRVDGPGRPASRGAGRPAPGPRRCSRGLAIEEAALGRDHPAVGVTLGRLAAVRIGLDRLDEAEADARRSLAILDGPASPRGRTPSRRGSAWPTSSAGRGRAEESARLCREAIDRLDAHPDSGPPPLRVVALTWLAFALRDAGRLDEAEAAARRLLDATEAEPDARGMALNWLARIVAERGRLDEAEALCRRELDHPPRRPRARPRPDRRRPGEPRRPQRRPRPAPRRPRLRRRGGPRTSRGRRGPTIPTSSRSCSASPTWPSVALRPRRRREVPRPRPGDRRGDPRRR